jgi:Leishmanolysin
MLVNFSHIFFCILGIGTLWESLQVTGLRSSNCPYNGPKANAAYKNITGCDVVPTENDGDPSRGTFCGHWDEECMQSELMTGALTGVLHPLSRISIATLDDLGYTVDYSSSERYGRDDVLSTCLCNRRSLTDMSSHGNAHQLGRSLESTQRRSLSDDGYRQAVNYGQAILQERQAKPIDLSERHKRYNIFERNGDHTRSDVHNQTTDDIVYVGDQLVVVFLEEGGAFFGVAVTPAL